MTSCSTQVTWTLSTHLTCKSCSNWLSSHLENIRIKESFNTPLPCRYSVVVEGERGNRPHIYCLEQLLQEAVSKVWHFSIYRKHNTPRVELLLRSESALRIVVASLHFACADHWCEASLCALPPRGHPHSCLLEPAVPLPLPRDCRQRYGNNKRIFIEAGNCNCNTAYFNIQKIQMAILTLSF